MGIGTDQLYTNGPHENGEQEAEDRLRQSYLTAIDSDKLDPNLGVDGIFIIGMKALEPSTLSQARNLLLAHIGQYPEVGRMIFPSYQNAYPGIAQQLERMVVEREERLSKVLSIGVGDAEGRLLSVLAQNADEVIVIDPASMQLQKAVEAFEKKERWNLVARLARHFGGQPAKVITYNGGLLSYANYIPTASMDLIVAPDITPDMDPDNYIPLLATISDLLKKGGVFAHYQPVIDKSESLQRQFVRRIADLVFQNNSQRYPAGPIMELDLGDLELTMLQKGDLQMYIRD
jgi:hypothetical protein